MLFITKYIEKTRWLNYNVAILHGGMLMDKKDIMLDESLEKLRAITTRNLRRVSDDIWGVLKPES